MDTTKNTSRTVRDFSVVARALMTLSVESGYRGHNQFRLKLNISEMDRALLFDDIDFAFDMRENLERKFPSICADRHYGVSAY